MLCENGNATAAESLLSNRRIARGLAARAAATAHPRAAGSARNRVPGYRRPEAPESPAALRASVLRAARLNSCPERAPRPGGDHSEAEILRHNLSRGGPDRADRVPLQAIDKRAVLRRENGLTQRPVGLGLIRRIGERRCRQASINVGLRVSQIEVVGRCARAL